MNTIIIIENQYMLAYIEDIRLDGKDMSLVNDLFALYMNNQAAPFYWIQQPPTGDTEIAPIPDTERLLAALQAMCKAFPDSEVSCWLESEELINQVDAVCESSEVTRLH